VKDLFIRAKYERREFELVEVLPPQRATIRKMVSDKNMRMVFEGQTVGTPEYQVTVSNLLLITKAKSSYYGTCRNRN
jgi:hypothetical protein